MRRLIFLHGNLKALHDGPIEVFASTIMEAIKQATLQIKGFAPNAKTGRKRVQVVGCPTVESLIADDPREEIHLMPSFNGGKKGGFLQILVGAVLIAAALIPGLNVMVGFALSGMLMSMGVSMLLGGVLQLLSSPKRDDANAGEVKSHYLGTPRNTVDIGTRIPILYGRRKVGGHYLSYNISAVEV